MIGKFWEYSYVYVEWRAHTLDIFLAEFPKSYCRGSGDIE